MSEAPPEPTMGEIDMDMATVMGFTAFGKQKPTKRKFEDLKSSGSNALPLGTPSDRSTEGQSSQSNSIPSILEAETQQMEPGKRADGQWDRPALRRGVRERNGDIAYYDDSFFEDPWARFETKSG